MALLHLIDQTIDSIHKYLFTAKGLNIIEEFKRVKPPPLVRVNI